MLYVDTSRKFRKNPRFWGKSISTLGRKFQKYFYRGGVTPFPKNTSVGNGSEGRFPLNLPVKSMFFSILNCFLSIEIPFTPSSQGVGVGAGVGSGGVGQIFRSRSRSRKRLDRFGVCSRSRFPYFEGNCMKNIKTWTICRNSLKLQQLLSEISIKSGKTILKNIRFCLETLWIMPTPESAMKFARSRSRKRQAFSGVGVGSGTKFCRLRHPASSTKYFGVVNISKGAEPRADICRHFLAPGAERSFFAPHHCPSQLATPIFFTICVPVLQGMKWPKNSKNFRLSRKFYPNSLKISSK